MITKKLMVIGEIGVGKTSLVRRFVLDRFCADYQPTMGVDIYRHPVRGLGPARSQSLELIIWDIDGHYGQSIFRHVYSRGSAGALIVGDLTRQPTLEHMAGLAQGFDETLPGRHKAFVLNKTDLCRPQDVSLPEALRNAHVPLTYTSALSGEHVADTFRAAAEAILRMEG